MRIAVISDIHGNLVALEAVRRAVGEQAVDQVICLGDLAFKGPAPGECVAAIRRWGIPCIHGNTDLMLLQVTDLQPARPLGQTVPPDATPYLRWHTDRMAREELEYLAQLPFDYRMEVDGLRLLFVHATPQDCTSPMGPLHPAEEVRQRIAGVEADWIIAGHIHQPYLFRVGGKLLINPGAVGFSLDGDWRAAFAVLDTQRRSVTIQRVEYSIDDAVAMARERDFCYDHDLYGEILHRGYW